MNEIVLEQPVYPDKYTAAVERMFDVPSSDKSVTIINDNLMPPAEWNIGLIYGPSGCGKSTLLKKFGREGNPAWSDDMPVISHFDNISPEEVIALFSAVGFNTAPAWLRFYHNLSEGEKFRCRLARAIYLGGNPIVFDEFTSVVDRNVAKSACNAFQKYIRKHNQKVVVASCHADIVEWLRPDWVYNPTEAVTHVLPRGSLQRPEIPLKIFRSKYEAWNLFKHHHYLSADLNKAARCFLATWNDVPVAFSGVLAMPNPYKKNCWRESRTVVLPDFQGLGLGVKLSDYIGSLVRGGGGSYYSKTIHPAMIAYRLKSGKWVETSHSRQARPTSNSVREPKWQLTSRACYSFEYIGPATTKEEAQVFWGHVDLQFMSTPPPEMDSLSRRDKDLLRKKLYRLRKKQEKLLLDATAKTV